MFYRFCHCKLGYGRRNGIIVFGGMPCTAAPTAFLNGQCICFRKLESAGTASTACKVILSHSSDRCHGRCSIMSQKGLRGIEILKIYLTRQHEVRTTKSTEDHPLVRDSRPHRHQGN
mmetsp:Transcript_6741/g.14457  ORF Transcript_6741/g.14457 Transcript_6741/m.14457 type:complete len:117 (+) Transcript_6741:149-499(+)